VCFAVTVVAAGVRSTSGVLIVPLEDEFGWSRATISFALGINLLLYGAIGPFAAAVMDRFGARRTITLALTVTAASVVLTPAMSHSWQLLLLWGVVVGLSTGFVGGFLAAYIAGRWFRAREGFVVGLLTAANAAGQLVFLPTMASLVTHFGWRVMSLVLASAVIAFLPLPAMLMRNRPEDVALRPYGDLGGSGPSRSPEGNPITVAFRALAMGSAITRFLADCGRVFCLRSHDQRSHRNPLDRRLRRSWA
jgi:MFS family permease